MPEVTPPPLGRFDPITGIWSTPGGLPADPARDAVDPDRAEPVVLAEPVPRELATPAQSDRAELRTTPTYRLRWVILALVTVGAAAVMLANMLSGTSGPIGWGALGVLFALAAYAAYRSVSAKNRRRPQ